MDYILKVLRMHGIRLRLPLVVSTLFLSLLLTACGGGSGPDDGPERWMNNRGEGGVNYSSELLDNRLLKTSLNSELLCQQSNILLCEDFEWSSSIAFQATDMDWLLKGWQYSGISSSGNFCFGDGADNSQCTLVLQQTKNSLVSANSNGSLQKASYKFSEYAASEKYIVANWQAKWSSNWRWAAKQSSVVRLSFLDNTQKSIPVISLQIKSNAVPVLVVADNFKCDAEINALQENNASVFLKAGEWHDFKLVFDATSAKRLKASLSLNNIIIATLEQDVSCVSNQVGINSIEFLMDTSVKNNTESQNLAIDNILVTY